MERGRHYGCNRSWNKIKVSPITTFLHISLVAGGQGGGGDPFYDKPGVSALYPSAGMEGRVMFYWIKPDELGNYASERRGEGKEGAE